MSAPTINHAIKRTCDTLKQGAANQVDDCEQRFSALKNLYDDLLCNLIVTGFNGKQACETAEEFFKETKVRFVAVDGTMYSRPLFDLVIFFGGAYASTGTVTFTENGSPKVSYDAKVLGQNIGISNVVPIYVNEIPEVDHSFASQEQPGEVNPTRGTTDEEIANNSLIANSIMTFSEYYLALKLAMETDHKTQIILMDRSLSTERASLLYETRITGFQRVKSAMLGYCPAGARKPMDENDMVIARHHVWNQGLDLPPPRSDHLRAALIALVERRKETTLGQILSEFNITDAKRLGRVKRALGLLVERKILANKGDVYSIDLIYSGSWERVKKLTLELGDKLFLTKTPSAETSSSMKILKNGKEHWLTTMDIAFLTLFTLQMLLEECWRKRILLVGITKDTAARDFKRQLVPIMYGEGMLKTRINLEAFQQLPNTDRMILQSASIFNPEKVAIPWGLIEYDSAFRTMKADPEHRKGYVSGLIRNKISLEKTFLKTYVQLSQAKSDPLLRSNVLLIDRLAYPEFDLKPENTVQFRNALSDGTEEPVKVLLFKDNTVPNKLQNLVITMLVAMAPANIPEAFGHNKPLFVADKIAKWNYSQFKCVVDSTATWVLNNHKLRKFIFYMSTFRERRSQIEQTRREHG